MKFAPAGIITRLKQTPAAVNFGWLALERGARLVISLLLGVWTARVLGPGDYGLLSYALALTVMLAVLPTWGMDQILRRELVRTPEERARLLGTVFSLRLVSGIVCYAVLVILALTTEFMAASAGIIMIAGLMVLQPGVQTIDAWFHARLEARTVVIAQNAGLIIAGGLRIAILIWKPELRWIVLSTLVDLPIAAVLVIRSYHKAGERLGAWRFDSRIARRLVKEAAPLLLTALAIMVYHRIDQVMLPALTDTTTTGHYAAAVRIVEVWHFVPMALAASWAPALVQAHTTSAAEFITTRRRQFTRYATTAWILALSTAATAPWLLPWLFGPAYAPAGIIAVVLSFSLPFVALGVARGEAWIAAGRGHLGLFAAVIGALANIALNFWWIPRWGAMGAAAATVVSYALAAVGTTFWWAGERRMGIEQLNALTLRGSLWHRS